MFDSIGWGEVLVIVLAGLFILGPERLPAAAAWLGRNIQQVRSYVAGASAQIREELGPEFDELRQPLTELRNARGKGRRMAVDAFLREPGATPSGDRAARDLT